MNLIVATPLASAVRATDVSWVRAEDSSGAFAIMRGHADFLTALSIGVLRWRDAGDQQHYVALRGGMLSVQRGELVTVATPEAIVGEDLHQLESEVLSQFRRRVEEERVARTDAQRLQLAAIRQIIRLLRPQTGNPALGGPTARASNVGAQDTR